MGDSVKAHNLSGITEYGESITSFSASLAAAAAQTQRSFTNRVTGQKGDVINAFFGKLNVLQDKIFQQAPEALKTYGDGVSDFGHSVQGLGFGAFAYTDKGEIDNIVNTLRGPQYDEMITKKNGLKTLMEEARDELGKGTVDFNGYEEKAQGFINDEITARNTTHQGISDADDALKNVADSGKSSFESLAAIIKNAQAIIGVSPKVIYETIIKTDNMTMDRLDYLDSIMSKEDAQLVEAIFTDNIESIMDIDSSKITKQGNLNMAREVVAWFTSDPNGEQKMNRLLGSMENKSQEREVKPFVKNVYDSLKDLGLLEGSKMQEIEKNDPNYRTNEEWLALDRRLKYINEASGIMGSARVLKIGSSESASRDGAYGEFHITYKKRGMQIRRALNGEWELVVTETKGSDTKSVYKPVEDYSKLKVEELEDVKKKEKVYDAHTDSSYLSQLEGEFHEEVKAMEKEREEADKEFKETVLKAGMKGLALYFGGPAAAASIDLLDSVSSKELSGTSEGTLGVLEELSTGKINKIISDKGPYGQNVVDVIGAFLDRQEKYKGIDAKLDENTRKFYEAIIDQGTWSLLDGENIIYQNSSGYVDYGSLQRVKELNDEGIVGFVDHLISEGEIRNVQPNVSAQSVITRRFSGDQAMTDYYLGNSNLDISEMNSDQLKTFVSGIKKIVGEDALDKFEGYMESKYDTK